MVMKYLVITLLGSAYLLGVVAPAYALEAQELQVSRVGDLEMGCGALSQEALLMREIVQTTEDIKDANKLQNHGITAAGALGSFLISSVTGGAGIAAAGFLLKQVNNGDMSEADSVQDIAKQRRSLMMGIYNAKGCFGPMEHVMQDGELDRDPLLEVAAIEPAAGNDDRKPRYNE